MLPQVDAVIDFDVQESTSRTFSLQIDNNRIKGYKDGIEAVKQAIYLMLNVERYKYVIYSWNYGVELEDLIGKPIYYVKVEMERRIKEALMQDTRIKDVYNFSHTSNKDTVTCRFNVDTIFGTIEAEKVVSI